MCAQSCRQPRHRCECVPGPLLAQGQAPPDSAFPTQSSGFWCACSLQPGPRFGTASSVGTIRSSKFEGTTSGLPPALQLIL